MKKKLIPIISSAVSIVIAFVMVTISWHNIDKAKKQNEILGENFTELIRIAGEMTEIIRESGMPKVLTYVRENKARAVRAVEDIRGVCDYFEKLTVPKRLNDKLAAVQAGIPDMRRFLDKYENMFHGVMLESEFKKYVKEMSDSASALAKEGSFIAAEQGFMRELEKLKNRKGGLMWL